MKPEIEAKDIADSLINSVNCFGGPTDYTEEVLHHLVYAHRTLNQAFVGRYVLPFIQKMAENYRSGNYDGRNEFASKVCNVMADAVEKEFGKLAALSLPLI